MAIADSHGDMADPAAVARAREFCGDYKPELRIHLGDCWDLRAMRAGATDDDQNIDDLNDDIEAGCELLSWYEPTHFLHGNHEHRIAKMLGSYGRAAIVAQYVHEKILVALGGAQCTPYCKRNGAVRLYDTTLVHGYGHGQYAPKEHAATYGKCLMGHIHTRLVMQAPGIPEPKTCYSIGCLCKLDMQYNAAHIKTLGQTHGFAFGSIRRGLMMVQLAWAEGGVWNV